MMWWILFLGDMDLLAPLIYRIKYQLNSTQNHSETTNLSSTPPHGTTPSEPTNPPTIPNNPTVCILISVTSAGQTQWSSLEHTFLYKYSFPTIPTTCETDSFTYQALIGYDSGDRLFDNQTTLDALQLLAQNTWPRHITLTTHSVANPRRKPGPVMNHLSNAAHAAGCDYLYRINDDTELLTQWTSAFVNTLASFTPPNIGVVGPTCHEGNTAILTHDFVHRTHIDIFGTHYPAELTDWWLDDWISRVYGEGRTLKLNNVVVLHHVLATRYEVTWSSVEQLERLVGEGNETLNKFILRHRQLQQQLRP
jgi:hypothetical protein